VTILDVFADVGCPFAHAGIRAILTWRADCGRDDLRLRVRAWPLELVNGQPLDPAVVAHEVGELRAQLGQPLFGGFDPRRYPASTLPAMALVAAAYRRDLETGERVSLALRHAVFEEGRDVADALVLQAIAAAHGVGAVTGTDSTAVQHDWADGRRLGVKGSPHLFCGGADAFCPSLDIHKDDGGGLHVRADPAALDAFLSGCVGQ